VYMSDGRVEREETAAAHRDGSSGS
jgi:hypothetical protein